MKARPVTFQRQRGVAVIIALLLTTLAITIVASLFWQQQVQVRSIENQRLQLQKQWILRGALDWASLILREDAKYSSVDTLDEPWATPLAETRLDQYVDDGLADSDAVNATLSGGITDAQARDNLTNLCPNGLINPVEVAVFAKLLNDAGIDPALAQATANVMAASQPIPVANDANTTADQTGPLPMKLTQVDDLLAVPGFTPAMLAKIRNFVIFLPVPTLVNVNTAPAEVLAAISTLSLSDATALVASRNTATFRNPGDFMLLLNGHHLIVADVAVSTSFFLVNGTVHMSRAGSETQTLIQRNGINTSLIWTRDY
ncbi:MAG TPA: type II secretion system minor pseudopilin GspK [Gallionella sp.]|nr:type II secretion system minor pseudopilin GspK [Gallionella sp.]